MEQLTIRATKATLPNLDEASLQAVDSLVTGIGALDAFRLSGAGLRSLEISGQRLTSGQVSGLRAGRASMRDLRMDCVDFTSCDLSQAACTGGRWSRVRFADCKVLAGHFREVTFENVIFDRCKLDLAAFQAISAKGPVIFRDCSLDEASFSGCDLSRAAFDGCRMTATAFERTLSKGTDLRGNDLSAIRGIASLRQAVIEPAQAIQLGHALIADLNLRLPDD